MQTRKFVIRMHDHTNSISTVSECSFIELMCHEKYFYIFSWHEVICCFLAFPFQKKKKRIRTGPVWPGLNKSIDFALCLPIPSNSKIPKLNIRQFSFGLVLFSLLSFVKHLFQLLLLLLLLFYTLEEKRRIYFCSLVRMNLMLQSHFTHT